MDSFSEHGTYVAESFHCSYTLNDDGSHPHVHGANLGVSADAYVRADGWASLATGEDHDLWRRLLAVGANRMATSAIRVITSGRRVGRAPLGFADALAAHNRAPAVLPVPIEQGIEAIV